MGVWGNGCKHPPSEQRYSNGYRNIVSLLIIIWNLPAVYWLQIRTETLPVRGEPQLHILFTATISLVLVLLLLCYRKILNTPPWYSLLISALWYFWPSLYISVVQFLSSRVQNYRNSKLFFLPVRLMLDHRQRGISMWRFCISLLACKHVDKRLSW